LQQERIQLVENFETWANEPDTPSREAALAALARMPVPDHRRVYKDHVSARWASAAESDDWEALKSLISVALVDGTLLDALLGRLFKAKHIQMTDQELAEAIKLCNRHMTAGRPWELGKWR
jgi:hypothetical protein